MERDEREQLWEQHYANLAGWCQAQVGDPDVARDIASESFFRLMTRWTSVTQPKAFLYVTAGNQVRDHWRRKQRDKRLLERMRPGIRSSTPPIDPWLRDLVERLPERCRDAVLLHYFADLSVADVALALAKPESTVKNALVAGRAALLTAFEEARHA